MMTHSPSQATHLKKNLTRNSSLTNTLTNTNTNTLNKDRSMKIFTGTEGVEHDKAHRTYLNELGPG